MTSDVDSWRRPRSSRRIRFEERRAPRSWSGQGSKGGRDCGVAKIIDPKTGRRRAELRGHTDDATDIIALSGTGGASSRVGLDRKVIVHDSRTRPTDTWVFREYEDYLNTCCERPLHEGHFAVAGDSPYTYRARREHAQRRRYASRLRATATGFSGATRSLRARRRRPRAGALLRRCCGVAARGRGARRRRRQAHGRRPARAVAHPRGLLRRTRLVGVAFARRGAASRRRRAPPRNVGHQRGCHEGPPRGAELSSIAPISSCRDRAWRLTDDLGPRRARPIGCNWIAVHPGGERSRSRTTTDAFAFARQ